MSENNIINRIGINVKYSYIEDLVKVKIKIDDIDIQLNFYQYKIKILSDKDKRKLDILCKDFILNVEKDICEENITINDYLNLKGRATLPNNISYFHLDRMLSLGIDENIAIYYLLGSGNSDDAINILYTDQEMNITISQDIIDKDIIFEKEIEPLYNCGYVLGIFTFIKYIKGKLLNYCSYCGKEIENDAEIDKICDDNLCIFAVQNGEINSFSSFTHNLSIIKFLIETTKRAIFSRRRNLILIPYPTYKIYMYDNYKILKNHIQIISNNIDKIGNLERILGDAYFLYKWILNTNNSHLRICRNYELMNIMKANINILVSSTSINKERYFQEMKSVYGSTFAFHGSSIENWYSILRNGLYNASEQNFR